MSKPLKYAISPLAETWMNSENPDLGKLRKPEFFSWEELALCLSQPRITQDKTDCPGFFPGISIGRRDKKDLESRSLLVLDLDKDYLPRETIEILYKSFAYVCYSTHSSKAGSPRWRVVFPLAETIFFTGLSPEEKSEKWRELTDRFFAYTGFTPQDDKASSQDPVKFFYFPAAKSIEDFVCWENKGKFLDLENLESPPIKFVRPPNSPLSIKAEIRKIEKALFSPAMKITNFRDYNSWLNVLMSVHAGTSGSPEGLHLVNKWSSGDVEKYIGETELAKKWRSFSSSGGIGVGTLFNLYKQNGGRWEDLLEGDDLLKIIQNPSYSKEDEGKKEENFNQLDKLYAFLFKNPSVYHSSYVLLQALGGISRDRLSELTAKDKIGENLISSITRQRVKYYAIKKESTLIPVKITEAEKNQRREAHVVLPGDLHLFFDEGFGGLPRGIFFSIMGFTNWGKSQFLLNAALLNAEKGKRILYLRHEIDKQTWYADLATRSLGRKKALSLSLEEQEKAIPNYFRGDKIKVVLAKEAALEEILVEVKAWKPEIVVWDYLDQNYILDCDVRQGSVPRKIAAKLANELCLEGISLLTAAQQNKIETKSGEKYESLNSWRIPMHLVLEYKCRPALNAAGNRVSTAEVLKTKDGPAYTGSILRWEDATDTFRCLKSWDATEEYSEEKQMEKEAKDRSKKKNKKESF